MSWVIVKISPSGDWRDGKALCEVFELTPLMQANSYLYVAVPIADWLAELQHQYNATGARGS